MGKKTTLNISEKEEVCACTLQFSCNIPAEYIHPLLLLGENSSIDALLVKYLVKSIYEKV
jgi:hypothetical protein